MMLGIATRVELLHQQVESTAHQKLVRELRNELACIRRDIEGTVKEANSLRHAVTRSNLRTPPANLDAVSATVPLGLPDGEAAAANSADTDRQLTATRHRLLRELRHLHLDVWLTNCGSGGLGEQSVVAAGLVNSASAHTSEAGGGVGICRDSASGDSDDSSGASLGAMLREGWLEGLRVARGYSKSASPTSPPSVARGSAASVAASLASLSDLVPPLPACESSPVGARAQARDLGFMLLLLQQCACYMGLRLLPFKMVFRASDSLMCYPNERKAISLSPEACIADEWRLAVSSLEANCIFVLTHLPTSPLTSPLSPNGIRDDSQSPAATRSASHGGRRSLGAAAATVSLLSGCENSECGIKEQQLTARPALAGGWSLRAITTSLSDVASGVVDAVVGCGSDGGDCEGDSHLPNVLSGDGDEAGGSGGYCGCRMGCNVMEVAAAPPPSAGHRGLSVGGLYLGHLNAGGSDWLARSLGSLLDVHTSLAWELHTSRCPLWERAERRSDTCEMAVAYGDEWAVVDKPLAPPPTAKPEDIGHWEAANGGST